MSSTQATARRAGALYLLFMIVGLIDMFGFTGFLVAGDATATALSISAHQLSYRVGMLTDLVALLLFIVLVVSLYRLFEGVDPWHAVLMVILVSVGVAVGLANLLTKIAPLILLSGADYLSVFSRPQIDALVLGALSLNSEGNTVAAVFWGLWLLPFGILVIRSDHFPRVLGVLLLVAGAAYLTTSITSIILPAYGEAVSQAATPLLLGEFPIIFWLLIKGAKTRQLPLPTASQRAT